MLNECHHLFSIKTEPSFKDSPQHLGKIHECRAEWNTPTHYMRPIILVTTDHSLAIWEMNTTLLHHRNSAVTSIHILYMWIINDTNSYEIQFYLSIGVCVYVLKYISISVWIVSVYEYLRSLASSKTNW